MAKDAPTSGSRSAPELYLQRGWLLDTGRLIGATVAWLAVTVGAAGLNVDVLGRVGVQSGRYSAARGLSPDVLGRVGVQSGRYSAARELSLDVLGRVGVQSGRFSAARGLSPDVLGPDILSPLWGGPDPGAAGDARRGSSAEGRLAQRGR